MRVNSKREKVSSVRSAKAELVKNQKKDTDLISSACNLARRF